MSHSLFVAWRSGEPQGGGNWGPVGRLDFVDGIYRFYYTQGALSLPGFSPFPGMSDLNEIYESEELLPLFANRLMGKRRSEYVNYLTWGGFDPNHPPDPIAILGVTEGRRMTDTIEVFPCPEPVGDGCYSNKFFLHGIYYLPPAARQRLESLEKGETLGLMWDIANPHDPYAIAVRTDNDRDNFLIGYVPRYLARDVFRLCYEFDPKLIKLTVERVNVNAPFQQRVLCRMTSCWPESFRPCEGKEFQPIVTLEPTTSRE